MKHINQLLKCPPIRFALVSFALLTFPLASSASQSTWLLIDDFESGQLSHEWVQRDTRNDTRPLIKSPQVTAIIKDESNYFLIKKPAAEGIVGNRKALTFRKLPRPIPVGATYTLYLRINVEEFPNNHIFGLSDMEPAAILLHDYNALEPSIRITDKSESDGTRNDGTLMVRTGDNYSKIFNHKTGDDAQPMQVGQWYEIWVVIDNALAEKGGTKYDVYIRGGDEFPAQQKVFSAADFRMKREKPLIYFLANCNTGPVDHPYGNGGLRYDDIYMTPGKSLTAPGTGN